MKLNILIIYFLTSFAAFGQDSIRRNWFAGLNIGYGLPFQKSVIDESIQGDANIPDSRGYEKDYITSLGKGFYCNISIGRILTDSSFIEFGGRYFRSYQPQITTYIYENIGTPTHYNSTHTAEANNIFLTLQYGVLRPIKRGLVWQIKSGFMVGQNYIRGKTVVHNAGLFSRPGYEHIYNYKYNSFLSIGWVGSTGVHYKVSKHLWLSADIFFQLQNGLVRNRETIKYTVDGADRLGELTDSEKNTEYYDGKSNNVSVVGKNQPLVIPMSSFGFSTGLVYLF